MSEENHNHLDMLYIESLKKDIENCNSEMKRFTQVYVGVKKLLEEEPKHYGIYYIDKLKEIMEEENE